FLSLIGLVLFVYFPIFNIPLYQADYFNIVGYPFTRSIDYFLDRMITLKGLTQRPLSVVSYTFNYYFTQMDPRFYYQTNLFIHLINTVLIYFVGKRFVKIPIIVAALFGLHPLATDAVSILQGRSYSLGTVFLL